MQLLVPFLPAVVGQVFGYLLKDVDPLSRIRIKSKLAPQEIAFELSLANAILSFSRSHAEWAEALFDETFLTSEVVVTQLSRLLSRAARPDPEKLAELWLEQFGAQSRGDGRVEAQSASSSFIELLEQELKSRSEFQDLLDSRSIDRIAAASEITAASVEALRVMLANVLGDLKTLATPLSGTAVTVTIDRVSRCTEVIGGVQRTYTEAGNLGGVTVYGRGQRVRMALTNQSRAVCTIRALGVRVISHEVDSNPTLRYQKMELRLPHTRLPIEEIRTPIVLRQEDSLTELREVGEGRIRLGPSGSSEDVHQVAVSVQAHSAGLWMYRFEAHVEGDPSEPPTVVRSNDVMAILLRGT